MNSSANESLLLLLLLSSTLRCEMWTSALGMEAYHSGQGFNVLQQWATSLSYANFSNLDSTCIYTWLMNLLNMTPSLPLVVCIFKIYFLIFSYGTNWKTNQTRLLFLLSHLLPSTTWSLLSDHKGFKADLFFLSLVSCLQTLAKEIFFPFLFRTIFNETGHFYI